MQRVVDRPILTIAIPTYNRADSLAYIVEKIAPYLDKNLSLLILDNHSTDETQRYCLAFSQEHSYVEYVRHSANVGGVVNMLRCIELSHSRYTWLLGDDDDIEVELLPELVRLVEEKNAFGYHLLAKSRQNRKISHYRFENKEEFENSFFDMTAMHLMSSNIFNTQEASRFFSEAYRLVHLQHAYTLFHVKFLEENHSVEILKLPILKPERIVVKRWSKFAAHLDAMETSYHLFGKKIASKEYTVRKKELLKIATQALFSSKDEGFDTLEVKRLFWMLGVKDFFYPLLFLMMIFLSQGSWRKYLFIYGLYGVYIFRYKNNYVSAMKSFFMLQKEESLYMFLVKNINTTRSHYFKN